MRDSVRTAIQVVYKEVSFVRSEVIDTIQAAAQSAKSNKATRDSKRTCASLLLGANEHPKIVANAWATQASRLRSTLTLTFCQLGRRCIREVGASAIRLKFCTISTVGTLAAHKTANERS